MLKNAPLVIVAGMIAKLDPHGPMVTEADVSL